MTAGLHVIAFTVRWLADRWIHAVVPAIDGQPLLEVIDRFEHAAGMRPAGGAYGERRRHPDGRIARRARSVRSDPSTGAKVPRDLNFEWDL